MTRHKLTSLLADVLLDPILVRGRVGGVVQIAPALARELAKHLQDGHDSHLLALELLGHCMPEHQVTLALGGVGGSRLFTAFAHSPLGGYARWIVGGERAVQIKQMTFHWGREPQLHLCMAAAGCRCDPAVCAYRV